MGNLFTLDFSGLSAQAEPRLFYRSHFLIQTRDSYEQASCKLCARRRSFSAYCHDLQKHTNVCNGPTGICSTGRGLLEHIVMAVYNLWALLFRLFYAFGSASCARYKSRFPF